MKNATKKILVGTLGAAGLFLASSNANADTTHTVSKGDCLWTLSQKYGISINSIEKLNNIDSNSHLIFVNQKLTIPSNANNTDKTTEKTDTVIVKKGDTLWAIAKEHNISVEKLRQLNGLSANQELIYVGDNLKVTGDVVQHQNTVQPKQTENTPTTNVASNQQPIQAPQVVQQNANNQQPQATQQNSGQVTQEKQSTPQVQQTEQPTQQVQNTPQKNTAPQVYVAPNHVTYTTEAGDSLYLVAQKFGVTVESLRESNQLGATLLIGQNLTVNNPTKTPQTVQQTHTQPEQHKQVQNQTASQQPQAQQVQAPQVTSVAPQKQQAPAQQATQPQPAPAQASASAGSVVAFAQTLSGIPYVWGGTTTAGFDCSGFTQYVYSHFGISIGRTTLQQQYAGTQVPVSGARVGDLLFWGSYGSAYHVGIYLGGTSYIAAPTEGESISVKNFSYYQPTFAVHVNGLN